MESSVRHEAQLDNEEGLPVYQAGTQVRTEPLAIQERRFFSMAEQNHQPLFEPLGFFQLFVRGGSLYIQKIGWFLNISLVLLTTEFALSKLTHDPELSQQMDELIEYMTKSFGDNLQTDASLDLATVLSDEVLMEKIQQLKVWRHLALLAHVLLVPAALKILSASASVHITAGIFGDCTISYSRLLPKMVGVATLMVLSYVPFLNIVLTFQIAVYLVENKSVWGTIRRSIKLFQQSPWRTVGFLLCQGTLERLSLVGLPEGDSVMNYLSLSISLDMLTEPIMCMLTTVLYFDIRIRHEGLDQATLRREMGVGEGQTATIDPLHDTVSDLTNVRFKED